MRAGVDLGSFLWKDLCACYRIGLYLQGNRAPLEDFKMGCGTTRFGNRISGDSFIGCVEIMLENLMLSAFWSLPRSKCLFH